jgi:Amt family ammonium transporter
VGDRLLVDVARRVVSCLRPGDTCARMGGDEFAVLLDEVHTVQDAERIARRVADRIAEPMAVDGEEIYVQASIGITMADGGYSSGDEILRDADIAMYCAKKGGLRLKAFDPSMHAVTKSRMMLETELRGAIERGEFVLHYQPIVSVATGAVTAFEALIRWAHPRRGLVPPADFVPALEETRLIVPLGRWVLGEACRQLRQWQRDRPWLAAARVTVNVSNVQFAHPGFGDDVREAVDRSGLDPRCLILEMTESAVMHDPESAARLLDELRGMGVVTYLDDFGTGYSSLAQLPRIPIEGLKIDRQFIARMSRDRRDHEMVRAITAISSNLGMTVIAEGVEEADQLACLKDLRCDWAQGYLISRPLAPAALEAMLLDSPPGPDSAASHGWATP